MILIYKSKISLIFFVFTKGTTIIDAKVCAKSYNHDAGSRETITVDYIVTGGRKKVT